MMTEEQEEVILNTRGERLLIENPDPFLYFNDVEYDLDRFQIRGESSLDYRRKSFSVNMDDPFSFYLGSEDRIRNFEKYKLISLVFDYTYTENCLAIELFKQVDLWPVHSFYTEVRLNNNTQGLYLFIEDPGEYFLYQQNASFILRRNYNHWVENYEINDLVNPALSSAYLAQFDSIYSVIIQYSGKQLYDTLMHLVDMPQYYMKLSVDMLLKNGDATDEIFFYTKTLNGREVYGVYPWDYDDLFAQNPHEIGRDWAVGTVFGSRTYSSVEDIIADVGEKLIFSIEDDLDYITATDEYLYEQYLLVLTEVLNTLSSDAINAAFDKVKNTIEPFYNNDEIIAQSQYDANETTRALFEENLENKRQFILDRREWILQKLHEINYFPQP